MPSPIDNFLKVAKYNDVDDKILDQPDIVHTIKQAEKLGINVAEKVIEKFQNKPQKLSGPTPSYKESAFVKPKKETTLYNVTNYEEKIPIVTKASQIVKDLSYSVRGLSLKAAHKIGTKESFGIIAGENLGVEYSTSSGFTRNTFNTKFNVGNQKASLNYKLSNPQATYNASVFTQHGNVGFTTKYNHRNGFEAAFSIDKNSSSAECSYDKKTEDYDVKLGAYATSGYDYKNPMIGVQGRVSF